jgi:hypothetical protein
MAVFTICLAELRASGLLRRRDDLRVVLRGHLGEALEDALNVHDHCFDGPRRHGHLLLEEVTGDRDPVAHEDFVGRAADPGDVDALGPLLLGHLEHLLVPGRQHDHLRKKRLVAVHDDVDLIFL